MSEKNKKLYGKFGDGQKDVDLTLPCDPLFKDVLGTGVTRRDLLKGSAAAAVAAAAASGSAAFADGHIYT